MTTQMRLPFEPPPRFCNRCNAEKSSNGPCPRCGCPEYRIVRGEPPKKETTR